MAKILGTVNDRSGIVVKVGFLDTDLNHIEITEGTWTLVNEQDPENVINGRERLPLPSQNEDGYYYIGLTDADTAFEDGENRYLVVEAKYFNLLTNSVLDIKSFTTFKIKDLRYII